MKEDIIPDLVNKATSFRTFRVRDGVLVSPIQHKIWDNPKQEQAVCKKFEHQSPEKECQCGIYGFHTFSQAQDYIKSADCLTITEHWGKTEVHSDGLRSEHASVKAIMPILSNRQELIEETLLMLKMFFWCSCFNFRNNIISRASYRFFNIIDNVIVYINSNAYDMFNMYRHINYCNSNNKRKNNNKKASKKYSF